jgi:hypothetical protein
MTIEIQSKEQVEDRIRVTVVVKDGETEKFGRSFTGTTWVNIESQIDQLRKNLEAVAVELENVPVGEFTPPVRVQLEPTALELAEQTLYELKRKIELGVLKETDQEFVDAVAAYKTAEGVGGK